MPRREPTVQAQDLVPGITCERLVNVPGEVRTTGRFVRATVVTVTPVTLLTPPEYLVKWSDGETTTHGPTARFVDPVWPEETPDAAQ